MDRTSLIRGSRQAIAAGLIAAALGAAPVAAQDRALKDTVEALQTKVSELARKAQLERGRNIYFQACSPCHGIRGDGAGPAAKGFDPAPRNFRRGVFKFRTTVSGALPLDSDLERTVREGLPGTEMPRWKTVLSEHDIKAVVQYIKTFSPYFDDPKALPRPSDVIKLPDKRPFPPSASSIAAGRKIYVDQDCIKCHGDGGAGDGRESNKLEDDWHVPIKPANLTLQHFKTGKRDHEIFRIFTTALNGTPMPAFDDLTEEQRWQLVDYIKSLEQGGLFYWLFKENPNQVRHPRLEDKPADAKK